MSDDLSDGERKRLYVSLLRGIGNSAQDRLCAADRQHAWGEWTRYQLVKELPLRPVSSAADATQETYRTRSERHCLNCGKVQHG